MPAGEDADEFAGGVGGGGGEVFDGEGAVVAVAVAAVPAGVADQVAVVFDEGEAVVGQGGVGGVAGAVVLVQGSAAGEQAAAVAGGVGV